MRPSLFSHALQRARLALGFGGAAPTFFCIAQRRKSPSAHASCASIEFYLPPAAFGAGRDEPAATALHVALGIKSFCGVNES